MFTSQGPGFYVLLQAIGAIFGASVAGVRLGIVTVDAIGAVFAFLLGRRLAGPVGGLACAGMIAIAPKLPDFGGRIFADAPAMVLVLAALWLVSIRRPLAGGAVFAAAVLVKLSALTALPTLVVLLALERDRGAGAPRGGGGSSACWSRSSRSSTCAISAAIWTDAVSYHVDSTADPGPDRPPRARRILRARNPSSGSRSRRSQSSRSSGGVSGRSGSGLCSRASSSSATSRCATTTCSCCRMPSPFRPASRSASRRSGCGRVLSRLRSPLVRSCSPQDGCSSCIACASTGHRRTRALVAAAARLEQLTRPDQLVISDQPIVAFLAHRRVPGKYVDTASLRFDTGSLTIAEVLRDSEQVAAVVAGRAFYDRPSLMAGLRARFRHRSAARGRDLLWALRWR